MNPWTGGEVFLAVFWSVTVIVEFVMIRRTYVQGIVQKRIKTNRGFATGEDAEWIAKVRLTGMGIGLVFLLTLIPWIFYALHVNRSIFPWE